MSIYLLVDFGSTYTKVTAVDLEKEEIAGWSQAHTTIETDITAGLNNAVNKLSESYSINIDKVKGKFASSSAAGGLKMAAIGLVPELTLEAAQRAALGAGAKVLCSYGFEIDEEIVKEIADAECDIILLSGGTDGGDKKTIIHNAQMLADSHISCPVLVAGNRVVLNRVRTILEKKEKIVYTAENVLPDLETVNIEPAQKIIRNIFISHIIKAKGLEKAQEYIGSPIIPTPRATLNAAGLLAEGTGSEPGIGSLLVVEIGGATTNIHSVVENSPVTPQTIIKGLPEQKVKRTVEGDLGIRYNARTIYDIVGEETLKSRLDSLIPPGSNIGVDIKNYVRHINTSVDHVPLSEAEFSLDITLAKSATLLAVGRHAGKIKREYTISGETTVQYGKNLLNVQNILGTGGVFKHGKDPRRILNAALFDEKNPWSLKPKNPSPYIDSDYIMYGIGLLSQEFPDQALRIAKKYLKQTALKSEDVRE